MRSMPLVLAVFLAIAPAAVGNSQEDQEEINIAENSKEFIESFESSADFLQQNNYASRLKAPPLFAMSNDEFDVRVKTIKAETPIAGVAAGDASILYDVILQPGHYGRTSGKIGTSGKLVSERALVAYITGLIAETLRTQGLKVLVISADGYVRPKTANPWDGLRAKSFLAIHADGNDRACSTGPSLGYEAGASPHAMHAIGYALATALGYEYEEFMRDNLTQNAAKYYMFNSVRSGPLKGILEIGELTCDKDEKRLVENALYLANNLAHALNFIVVALPK